MNIPPFSMPDAGTVLSIAAITASSTSDTIQGNGNQIMFINTTSQACFVAVGDSLVEASLSNDILIHGNSTMVFSVSPEATHVAARTAAGSTTLLSIRGNGF